MARVMNRYLTGGPGTADPVHNDAPCEYPSFLGSAAATAAVLRATGQAPAMRYMADSWVLDVFRNCPKDFPSVGPPWDPTGLICPNASLTDHVASAVKRGDIWMHAFPHNGQAELMDATMFSVGVNSSIRTAIEMGSPNRPRVMSQRDVPGLTRAVIPHLKKRGVIGISVGSNDGSPAPQTPSTIECDVKGLHVVRTPFLWLDENSGESLIVDIHPGGYGGITGDYSPPGDSKDGVLCDCIGVEGLDDVLCYAWRGDNYGPARAPEVREDFRLFRTYFPNATIMASTLGDYFDLIENDAHLRNSLPVLKQEVGDTWMYGCASDLKKLAKMRAMQRTYSACHAAGQCGIEQEPQLLSFQHYALKLFEHTWGGSTAAHMNITRTEIASVWTAQQLAAAKSPGPGRSKYKYINKLEATWDEQRLYIDKAVAALGAKSALRAAIEREFAALTAPIPSINQLQAEGFTYLAQHHWNEPLKMGRFTVAFDTQTGALVRLDSSDPKEGTGWATRERPLGKFGYRSHSFAEWERFQTTYAYSHGGAYPYPAPGPPPPPADCRLMNNCSTVSKMWRGRIIGMWHRSGGGNASAAIVVRLQVSSEVEAAGYGAPKDIFLTATELAPGEAARLIRLELSWGNKAATRLYEGIYFDMHPPAWIADDSDRQLSDSSNSKLLIDKIGSVVDASDVVSHGGSAVHGMDPKGGVTFVRPSLSTASWHSPDHQYGSPAASTRRRGLHIKSLDAGLVLPAAAENAWNFSAFYEHPAVPQDGVSFNLMNNYYMTNYVLWFPWRAEDTMARFRFELSAVLQ